MHVSGQHTISFQYLCTYKRSYFLLGLKWMIMSPVRKCKARKCKLYYFYWDHNLLTSFCLFCFVFFIVFMVVLLRLRLWFTCFVKYFPLAQISDGNSETIISFFENQQHLVLPPSIKQNFKSVEQKKSSTLSYPLYH